MFSALSARAVGWALPDGALCQSLFSLLDGIQAKTPVHSINENVPQENIIQLCFIEVRPLVCIDKYSE